MADLRIEDTRTSEEYAQHLLNFGVSLPVRQSECDFGVVVDANGREVFTVDVNAERPERDVAIIMAMIVVAVNTCGGFKAARSDG